MAVLNLDAAIATIKAHRDHLARTNATVTAWDPAGIRAMLTTADGPPTDILAAALLAAGDATCRLPSPGALRAHWPTQAQTPPPAPRNVDWCPEHPGTIRADCARHAPPVPPTAEYLAAKAQLPKPGPTDRRPAIPTHARERATTGLGATNSASGSPWPSEPTNGAQSAGEDTP